MNKKIVSLFAAAFFTTIAAHAQQTLNASGGSATIAGNTYEWSVGEMVLINTAGAGNIVITQGLLQPGKPLSGTAINESQFIFDHVTVYPNPADNMFFLNADFNEQGLLNSSLYDMNGKLIEHKELPVNGQASKLSYNISALSAGNYMLVVSFTPDNNKGAVNKAAFKIEKTN